MKAEFMRLIVSNNTYKKLKDERFIAECMGEIENDKVGYAQKKIEKRQRMEQALLEDSKQCFGVVLLIISWLIFGVVAH